MPLASPAAALRELGDNSDRGSDLPESCGSPGGPQTPARTVSVIAIPLASRSRRYRS